MDASERRNAIIAVHFNLYTYQWEASGTAEEIEKKQQKSAYMNNPVIITIKQLLKNTLGGWKGTASDLLKACFDVTKEPVAESPTSIGKLIQSYEQYLYEDGISHSMKKSGNLRTHIFFPAKYRTGWQERLE